MEKVVYSSTASLFKGGHKLCCYFAILISVMICENRLCLYTEPTKKNETGNILSTMINGATINYHNVQVVFTGIGIVIAMLGLISSFILLSNSGIIEVKDSYTTMIVRFVASLFAVLLINGITLKCLEFGKNLEETMNSTVGLSKEAQDLGNGYGLNLSDSLMGGGLFFNMLTNGVDKNGKSTLGWFEGWQDSSAADSLFSSDSTLGKAMGDIVNAQYDLCAAFLNFLVALLVTWNLVKLAIEMIKRYVMTQILQMVSPMFGGFVASASSMNVFMSYVKMFATEIFIYLLTKLWFALSIMLLSSGSATTSLAAIIMIYAFLFIGVKMENIAKDFGLTTSCQGATLLDNMIMNGAILGASLGGIKNGVGKGLFSLGAMKGNAKLAAIGGALSGKPMDYSPAGLQKAMQGSIPGALRKASTANSLKSNLTNSMKAGAFDALRHGGFEGKNALSSIAGNLNNAGKQDLFGAMADEFFRMPGSGNSLAQEYGDKLNISGMDNGMVTGKLSDANGNDIASFSIGSTRPQSGSYQEITDANGDARFMSFTPLQDQSQLAGKDFENSSASNLLDSGRGLTVGEMATGCMLNSENKLYHGEDGSIDTVGANYSTCALGDNTYGIVHSNPLTGEQQISAIDFGSGKVAEHGSKWNNLDDVNTQSAIGSYFAKNLDCLDKNAMGIKAISASGADRFTVSFNSTKDGEDVLMKKEFMRVTDAATNKLGDVDSLGRLRNQRFIGNSDTGHWIGSNSKVVKDKSNERK